MSIREQQGRLHELQSLHQELNKRAPIGVRVYGFSTVVNTNNAESSVGILMDRGRPIFRGEGLPQEERVAFCKQLLTGVQAMHKNGITHGDIKVSIERHGDREIDTSNLMMRINDKGEREPCLIDWGESIDHTALRSLEQEKAASLAGEKVPSPAFTPYELTSQLRQTSRGLDRLSPADYKKGLDKYFEMRKAQDEFNTAVAIVQILSDHKEDFSHEVIRVQGASRGEYEPDVPELLKNIPEKTPKDLRNFLEKTLKKETKLI